MAKLAPICLRLLVFQSMAVLLLFGWTNARPLNNNNNNQNNQNDDDNHDDAVQANQTSPNEMGAPAAVAATELNNISANQVEPSSPTDSTDSSEDNYEGPEFICQKLQRLVKKILQPAGHKCESLNHRDYVVSDREFELVLKRLGGGESTPLACKKPHSGRADEEEEQQQQKQQQQKEGAERSIDQNCQLDKPSAGTSKRSEYRNCAECLICLDELGRGELVGAKEEQQQQSTGGQTPNEPTEINLLCRHRFHLNCIAKWVQAKRPGSVRCPVCMKLLRIDEFSPDNKQQAEADGGAESRDKQ